MKQSRWVMFGVAIVLAFPLQAEEAGVGAVKPMCPARIPAKSTKVTPSETPNNLIFPR